VTARTRIGDQATVKLIDASENVPVLFYLPHDVPVLPGKYQWTNFSVGVRSFQGRMLTLQGEVICCSFYDGSALRTQTTLIFRPSLYFEISATHEANLIDLPSGKVDIHLGSADAVINFTPDMQLAVQVQYDNISENFGLSARYRWEYRPGNELFIGVGQSAMISNQGFVAQATQATVRIGQTFRF
jgi:hypothetical protein